MKRKDDLYTLVKSIDKHEKRFFKLYAKLHNKNKSPQYLYLFDILDGMDEFDANRLKLKFSKVLPGKNLSRLKQYLKQHIFNALNAYNKKGLQVLQENEDINTVKVLMDKNLYVMAEKVLKKNKKRCN